MSDSIARLVCVQHTIRKAHPRVLVQTRLLEREAGDQSAVRIGDPHPFLELHALLRSALADGVSERVGDLVSPFLEQLLTIAASTVVDQRMADRVSSRVSMPSERCSQFTQSKIVALPSLGTRQCRAELCIVQIRMFRQSVAERALIGS